MVAKFHTQSRMNGGSKNQEAALVCLSVIEECLCLCIRIEQKTSKNVNQCYQNYFWLRDNWA